jgi:methionine synthase I (cobalamin-dependent)
LVAAGVDVVGANCGQGIEGFVKICARLRNAADGRPVWIKANAGLPKMVDDRPFYATTPREFASHLPALLEAGAGFIGGCCGTTPAFITELRQQLDRLACT